MTAQNIAQSTERFEAAPAEEDRYRLLLEAVTDYAIYMLDPSGIVTSWNPGAQRFKGYTPAEIIGQHFSRFYTPEDRAAGVPKRALETAEREGKFETEGWRVRKDGTRFWAQVVIDPIRTSSGALLGFAKVTRDLTERRAAEQALRRSEEEFRHLVEGVTDYALYMLDPKGHVSTWNTGAQRIKGYLPSEIIGQHFSRFYTEEERNQGVPQYALETALREGRYEKEGWRVRKDGTRFWANVVIDPIRDERGGLIGFAKITRDITERKETERALEEAREALFQSQKMDAIGQLTGGIAHDFNNLLMAVMSSLEIARKRIGDPKTLSLVDNALQGAQRGAALTQRMLAFARRQDLVLTQVDVRALITGMTDLLQRALGPSVSIETCFPPILDAVMADPNQLELAVLNLAVNARDAMPGGGPIVIAARKEMVTEWTADLEPGPYVCLSLTDHGTGMSEETLARAMEPFFTTKGVGKGTGLGLSMVHGMTAQSGGRFILHSREGEGTTAEIWLRVAQQDVAKAAPPVTAAECDAVRPLTVLAVDDDGLVLMNTTAMLEDLGHTVIEASSGKEALAVIRNGTAVDLVITDQAMPRMTGAELAEIVATERPDLPILVATGYAQLPDGIKLPRLSKPFGQDDLARAIAAIFAAH
ncbi:MAG TPA: PAS domain S-box protein [Rhizomicrobium sp.]